MRATIAGTGAVCAAGSTATACWDTYRSGKKTWVRDASTGLPVYAVSDLPVVAEIDRFQAERGVDRTTLLALHAARQAVTAAGWTPETGFSILVGCSRGPTLAWESAYRSFAAEGVPPLRTSPDTTLGSIGFALADFFDVQSLASSLSVTCSSGFHALLHGLALLQSGMADRVLVGGTEASLSEFTLRQMEILRVYATPDSGEPYACRPFSTPPSGMVIGEGAAFLALERDPRPGKPRITGLGFGREGGQGATGISRDGTALQATMRAALATTPAPNLIVAHAPGTRRGDAAERAALGIVFPGLPPPVTSLKWATGHTFGASGPLALVAAIEMMDHGESLGLPYHRSQNKIAPETVLVNATGFGGNAVSVVVQGPV